MQLPIPDVDRGDTACPGLQQTVCESAGRCADVGAVAPGDIDAERVERVLQLLASARDEARRLLHLQVDVVPQLLAGFRVTPDTAGEDERLGLRARLREPALDEQDVEPLLHAARLATPAATTRRAPIRREP